MPHMHATEPGIRLAVGVSESGKTFGIRRDLGVAAEKFPIIVMDQTREWVETPVPSKRCSTVKRAVELVGEGARFVIVRVEREQLASEGIALCTWALSVVDREKRRQVGIAIPEAQNICPNGRPLSPVMLELVTAWRHHKVAAWFDTQRFALLDSTIAAQAREVRLYTMHSDLDIARAKGMVRQGAELVTALDECADRFDRREYGWHVTLGNSRRPPYTPER